MSEFAKSQPAYAERGIPTFPVIRKRPAVSGYPKLGLAGSSKLPARFPKVDAFGFACGQRSRITVLDVDTNDERA
jgi:hypothetical protein